MEGRRDGKVHADDPNDLIKDKAKRWAMFLKVKFWDSYHRKVRKNELEMNKSKADLQGGPKCCQTT